jgi:citrate synthase
MQTENHRQHRKVESRNSAFVKRTVTGIWMEKPTEENPYIASQVFCHGYDLIELMKKRSFIDVLFLLFKGELPNQYQVEFLQTIMIGFINPGPRHPATRAAMNAAVGKTNPLHILPIGMGVLSGHHLGAGCIEDTMIFFERHKLADKTFTDTDLDIQLSTLINREKKLGSVLGFGTRYGGIDPIAAQIATHLARLQAAGDAIKWGEKLSRKLAHRGEGWLMTGVAAAAFIDLQIPVHLGGPLFQLMSAPGILAHGAELIKKPITAMPFVSDEQYQIEQE